MVNVQIVSILGKIIDQCVQILNLIIFKGAKILIKRINDKFFIDKRRGLWELQLVWTWELHL